MILGAVITLGSCPPYAFSLIGPQTIIIGLAMIAGGSALLAWRPRLKDTNEALLIAMKYGNSLTATRLALEMDVSFEKAEKIIRELVRSGVAEIDLDQKDPDQGITYKDKGPLKGIGAKNKPIFTPLSNAILYLTYRVKGGHYA